MGDELVTMETLSLDGRPKDPKFNKEISFLMNMDIEYPLWSSDYIVDHYVNTNALSITRFHLTIAIMK